MIKKTEGGYKVVSEKGNKNLDGPYKNKKGSREKTAASGILQAQKRLMSRGVPFPGSPHNRTLG
jgi:hypothetical protein